MRVKKKPKFLPSPSILKNNYIILDMNRRFIHAQMMIHAHATIPDPLGDFPPELKTDSFSVSRREKSKTDTSGSKMHGILDVFF